MSVSMKAENSSLFGSSGIRLPFGRKLLDISLSLGLACGRQYHNILVGCDTRTSSDLLKNILISGLEADGARVMDAGIVPTPTLALATKNADLGIMVTASHNPPEYNGFKIIEPNGSGIRAEVQREIETAIGEDSRPLAKWTDVGMREVYGSAVDEHRDIILRSCPLEKKVKAVVDSCCGAASYVTPLVLSEMGCEVVPMNCYHSGYPSRSAEPIEANLSELAKTVRTCEADFGIAHDIDADRMMIVDEKGNFVTGDKLLVVFAQAFGFRNIVTTLDASMILEEIGYQVTRTRIGDVHVSWELGHGGDFGAEPSGSWIFPEVSLCPDGIYAAAKVASLASRCKLSELLDLIPEYPIIRGSIDSHGVCLDELENELLRREDSISDICRMDGLRVAYDDSWVLVRRSGTESKIRLTIEANSDDRLRLLYQKVMESVESCRNGNG